jgi:hypothetical protein
VRRAEVERTKEAKRRAHQPAPETRRAAQTAGQERKRNLPEERQETHQEQKER